MVFLTERYLRLLHRHTTVQAELKGAKRWYRNYKVFVALEPKIRKKNVSRTLTKKFSQREPPHILDVSSVTAREKNYQALVKLIRDVEKPEEEEYTRLPKKFITRPCFGTMASALIMRGKDQCTACNGTALTKSRSLQQDLFLLLLYYTLSISKSIAIVRTHF